MARSLSQMLLAQASPIPQQSAMTQAQRGVQQGIQLATLQEDVDAQRAQAEQQRLQAENAKLNFLNKGLNQIRTAASDGAAKRKAQVFKNAAERAGITISDDFLADAAEQREKLSAVIAGLSEIQTNPNISQEQKQTITSEALQLIAQDGSFDEAFTASQNLAQMQARQTAREETAQARQDVQLSRNLVKAQNDFEKRVKNERQRLEGVTTIGDLLRTGQPISQNVAQFQLARLAQGAGVLTDRDIARLGGSRALRNRVESAVSTILEGKPLTPRDVTELQEIVELFDTRLNEQIQEKAESFARGRAKALKSDPAEILDVLDVSPQAAQLAEETPGTPGQQAAEAQGIQDRSNAIAELLSRGVSPQSIRARLGEQISPAEEAALAGGRQEAPQAVPPEFP